MKQMVIGLRLSVSLSVYPSVGTLTVAFLDRLSPNVAQTQEPPKVTTCSAIAERPRCRVH